MTSALSSGAGAAQATPQAVGILPKEWRATTLGQFLALQRGHDLTARERKSGEVPVMGSAGQNGFHDTALAPAPGIVLGRSGASFGQAHFCNADYWPHNTALYVTDFHGNDVVFAFHFLKGMDFSRHNSGGAQQSLNRNFIYPIPIRIPPLCEQRAIASALSDADVLLEKLDSLIAKKRDLKQSTMQRLLTGRTRLPGFSGRWQPRRLDKLADIRGGSTPSTLNVAYWNGAVPWCTPTDITALQGGKYLWDTTRKITQVGLEASAAELIPPGSVVMTSRATIGECAINMVPLATNQGFKNFIPRSDAYGEFLFYLLQTKKQEFIGLCSGSTFLEIGKSQLARVLVNVPEKNEQVAIARVLSDMDAEFAALEARRGKTIALKNGMMQELLTGRIRLI